MRGKVIVFSAPSGSGKTTLVHWLLEQNLNLHFSISATSRAPRGTEQHGKDYYFITPDEFREKIAEGAFLEYEEVYTDKYYGSLKHDVETMLNDGKNVLFDVDVKGGINIKSYFGSEALSIFVQPPSIDVLEQRLTKRGTDAPAVIRERIAKASYELSFAPKFDVVVVNNELEVAKQECLERIRKFVVGL
jgi:guanylate kinase